MTVPRSQIVDPELTRYYHCTSRCVRGAHLCGDGYEHRKEWLEKRLEELVGIFAIDVCSYTVLDNHMHVVVRLDPEGPARWTDKEVAQRWARLYPLRDKKGAPIDPTQAWIQDRAADEKWIAKTRVALANLGWFMKSLKEPLARRANKEDGCTGAFWAARYKSTAILDDESLLATCAYVDLNYVAAGLADVPEMSVHTSIRTRLDHCRRQGTEKALIEISNLETSVGREDLESGIWLCPIEFRGGNTDGHEGMLEGISLVTYLKLIDWTSRLFRIGKARVGNDVAPIFERLQINASTWERSLRGLLTADKLTGIYIGGLARLAEVANRRGCRWVKHLGGRGTLVHT